MKSLALSCPNLFLSLLAGLHVAQVVVAQQPAACEGFPIQHLTVTEVVTHTLTVQKQPVTNTLTDLITRTITVTQEPKTYTMTQTVFPLVVTRTVTVKNTVDLSTTLTQTVSLEPSTVTQTVTDTATQSAPNATITLTVTSLQSPTTCQSNLTSPTTCSIPALAGFIYSPYKDTSINMNFNTNQVSTEVSGVSQLASVAAIDAGLNALTFAFAIGECGSEAWAGINGAAFAQANVADWRNAGLKYILSTGGPGGLFTCGSDAGMETFLGRYASSQLEGVDFYIDAGQDQSVINDLVARVQAAQCAHPNLRFSFSLNSLGGNAIQSLDLSGQYTMSAIQTAGLTNYYINLQAMDYGAPSAAICVVVNGTCDMAASAIAAATNLHNEYNVPYNQIELTVMIGGNDATNEIFTFSNADTVAAFVLQNGLGGLHFWSFDRDVDCTPGVSSPTCNSYGVAGTLGFTKRFLSDGI
jgi:hypothetical protein